MYVPAPHANLEIIDGIFLWDYEIYHKDMNPDFLYGNQY